MIAHRADGRPRRGFGLIEMAITGLLLAAAMAATVKVVGWVALERRSVERRERALLEASNLMERIAARPWDEVEPGALRALRLPESARAFLPGSTLSVKVEGGDDAPARKRVTVEIRWDGRSGRPEAPARMVAWVHRRGGARP